MCGIVGIVGKTDRNAREIISLMNNEIKHRGPDSSDLFVDKNISFGHARLSIIDLSPNGSQPMTDYTGRYTIVYNGELYNYKEIKKDLIEKGYVFNSKTDTEVILNAYVEFGSSCVEMFNGMFAFAIWDKKINNLFIARDRYGVKPLYYTKIGNKFIFASEIKAILKYPDYIKKMNQNGLVQYLTFQNFFNDQTLFDGIYLFKPAHFMTIKYRDGKIFSTYKQYWDYDFDSINEKNMEYEEYVLETRRLFSQAVKRQLVSDVEVASYLSGGIDSASIASVASKHLNKLKTFTCGFSDIKHGESEVGLDERTIARFISSKIGSSHYETVLSSDIMENLFSTVVRSIENPMVGQSTQNYLVSNTASKFVKVALSGAGGDELFGGYPWRYYRTSNSKDFNDYINKYYTFWQRLVPNNILSKMFKSINTEDVDTINIFKNVFNDKHKNINNYKDCINNSLYFEAKTFLHGLLVVEDKLGMASGLENRFPFLDNDLVDFAMKIPVEFKIRNLEYNMNFNENNIGPKVKIGYIKTNDGKLILRDALSEYLPKEIINNNKQGFISPNKEWYKNKSRTFVESNLLDKSSRIHEYLDRDILKELIESHMSGRENKRLLIWSLLFIEFWLKEFM